MVCCKMENHFGMPFEYVCTHPLCLKNTHQLACVYCCQEYHKPHLDAIKALKTLLSQIYEAVEDTEYGAGDILIKGIANCRNEDDLRQNISEVISYYNGESKFEKLLDQDCIDLRDQAKSFYENRGNNSHLLEKTVKKNKQKLGQCSDTIFINPIFIFSAEDAAEQNYNFRSPFCVSNK